MPTFDEKLKCHFFDYDCLYPITKEILMEILGEPLESEVVSRIPPMDDPICTNCLLATLIVLIDRKLPDESA